MNQSTSFDDDGRTCPGGPKSGRPVAITPYDEVEFRGAMAAYKERSGRQFPTWSEILELLQSLGYEKRIWQPVRPIPPAPPGAEAFRALGEDASTGALCWFAQVETLAGR